MLFCYHGNTIFVITLIMVTTVSKLLSPQSVPKLIMLGAFLHSPHIQWLSVPLLYLLLAVNRFVSSSSLGYYMGGAQSTGWILGFPYSFSANARFKFI
jgi:hypothetical protein